MCFIANLLNEMERGGVVREAYRIRLMRQENFFFFFGEGADRDIEIEHIDGLNTDSELALTAVEDD